MRQDAKVGSEGFADSASYASDGETYRFAEPGQRRDDRHTRVHEFRIVIAGAMVQTYTRLLEICEGIQARIEQIYEKFKEDPANVQELRPELDNIKKAVEMLSEFDEDITALIRMMPVFKSELKEMGVNFKAMKRELSDMLPHVCTGYGKRRA
ncbi:MAG: hypothetical protein H0W86_08445 [Armatimonadetes bacterium]|nr:hypothetical protein [Armatimonadota bacterium]